MDTLVILQILAFIIPWHSIGSLLPNWWCTNEIIGYIGPKACDSTIHIQLIVLFSQLLHSNLSWYSKRTN